MLSFFTTDIRRNIIKILCLTIGLAVGFLLVAKLYFNQTYDSFFPEADRIFQLKQSFVLNGEYIEYGLTPGGSGPELRRKIPQIEATTRFTTLTGATSIRLDDGRIFDVENITLADSSLFEVLPTPILEGNPKEILAIEDHAMIPRSLADKIGGEVIGLKISDVSLGDSYKATIGGVYEDYPLNSTIRNSIYLGLPTIGKFMYDGSDNLMGNDRYNSYVRLAKGSDAVELQPVIQAHVDKLTADLLDDLALGDYRLWLRPLTESYTSQPGVRIMSRMLGILAVVLLMCAGLNYLLITIGQLGLRGKEMAIRKCYGTPHHRLFSRIMGESLFFLVVSLGLAVLVAFSFSGLCKDLLDYTPGQLFSTGRVWVVEIAVCLGLLIITGVVPSVLYSRTPVGRLFHPAAGRSKIWKLTLLALQFFATGLIMCLLVLTERQNSMLGNKQLGYDYENIAFFVNNGLDSERRATLKKEIGKLPFVEGVASSSLEIGGQASGNMVWIGDDIDNQVNIADMERINPEIIDVMGIKIIQGENFGIRRDSTVNEVLVEQRFIDLLQKYFGETDGDIIGKKFHITGHGNPEEEMTIVGVVENLHRGGFEIDSHDTRAGIFFPSNKPRLHTYIRLSDLNPDNLKRIQTLIDSLAGGKEIYVIPFRSVIDSKRDPVRKFGTAVMVTGIAILIIALTGLIGYVADEVNRRAKEIAIRKVNGTSAAKILRLFCLDIIRVALPSLIAGGAVAMIIGHKWLARFSERVSLSPASTALSILILLLIINTVVVVNSMRVAKSNPVDHLRSE